MEIARALQRETITPVRTVLNDVLRLRSESPAPGLSSSSSLGGVEHSALGQAELARLIRHELAPPIGWARRAGASEIEDFAASSTSDALDRLDRRIDALVALIRSEGALDMQRSSLQAVLKSLWPIPLDAPIFAFDGHAESSEVEFDTDLGLFELIIANAYQNALDSVSEFRLSGDISVTWGVTSSRFWVRISNPFHGDRFDISEVSAEGVTTKSGHKGVGLSVMKQACNQLHYSFRISGRASVATFVLSGSRWESG
ncbi:GHKL domain-containing protein [Curtobacterium aurantiacum]|uniref:ATP-binding protein n=1 Tax=Curtobacterium aurantiacum TaxID=3236919 RepID=A0ABS5VGK4_9MICO|nr:GHKL domain-containing protein [Curtobacterium flaccumfaciens]MBT1545183.1 ATP-binding protein [Curtobacterium flaccumfaciens pv. flaccumfaciens]MBT1587970.1 ATP-binding protein [Curtobacterium flaccumfaciens pv. flaccumfaciens]